MWNLRPGLTAMLTFLALAVFLAGCAATTSPSTSVTAPPSSMENLLTQAGFKAFKADTPQKAAFVQKMPDEQLVPHKRKKDGALRYLYADKANKRVYIGDAAAYQNFINLAVVQKLEERHRQLAPMQEDDPEFLQMWVDAHGGG
jgi:PBP1b-binding outer membrane lipoprotein LpoB